MTLEFAENVSGKRTLTASAGRMMENRHMISKVEKATEWIEKVAEDDSHGYSQASRWGTPDYDCSSLVIMAWQQAGVPVKDYGATYTGNMRDAFLKAGFKDVTASINLNTGAGLHRGDVLLNYVSHTCMYIGNGKVVNARGDNGHPQAGDQDGTEIRIQTYWNFPWNCVLRYPETIDDGDEESSEDAVHPAVRRSYYHIEYGDGCVGRGYKPQNCIKAWQELLLCWGMNIGSDGVDGQYGEDTMNATKKWQQKVKDIGGDVEVNGIVDEDDWKEIIEVIICQTN